MNTIRCISLNKIISIHLFGSLSLSLSLCLSVPLPILPITLLDAHYSFGCRSMNCIKTSIHHNYLYVDGVGLIWFRNYANRTTTHTQNKFIRHGRVPLMNTRTALHSRKEGRLNVSCLHLFFSDFHCELFCARVFTVFISDFIYLYIHCGVLV